MIQSKRIPYYWHQTVKSMCMPYYSGGYQNQVANRNLKNSRQTDQVNVMAVMIHTNRVHRQFKKDMAA